MPICAVLSELGITIAPFTYYARRSQPVTDAELEEAYTANALRTLWQDNCGVYGARKLWHAARRSGIDIGRDQVARLMRITGAVRGGAGGGTARSPRGGMSGRGGTRTWSSAAGRCRTVWTSCG